jgi:predicted  nucleic acid-binding Zn-ribbon protein
MAKEKVEQELTVEEKLRALYELQTVNTKIDGLRILAGELPQEVKDMGDEIEGLKTRLTNIENGIKECETGISDHRVRIENSNAAISRYKEQQNNVRNNREYDNLTKEIEYQELEIEAS